MTSLPWQELWTPDSEPTVADPVVTEALQRLGWTQRVVKKLPMYPGVVPVVLLGAASPGGPLPGPSVLGLPVSVLTGNHAAANDVITVSPDSTIYELENAQAAGDMDGNGASIVTFQWNSPRYLRDLTWMFKTGSVSAATGGVRLGLVLWTSLVGVPPAAAPAQGMFTAGPGTYSYWLDAALGLGVYGMVHLKDVVPVDRDLTAQAAAAGRFFAAKRRGTDSSITTDPTPFLVDTVPHIPFQAITISAYLGLNDAVGKLRAVFTSS